MNDIQSRSRTAIETTGAPTVDLKLEVVVIPVADVERAKRFYSGLGWRLDGDFVGGDAFRGVQFTPPGSPCLDPFRQGNHDGGAGLGAGLYLVVSDIEAARAELVSRGVEVSEVFHRAGPRTSRPSAAGIRSGRSYSSFATFKDPDGNGWLLQEVTARLPGRVDANETNFTSPSELAAALRRARGCARRAREAERRPARRELAGLVRRIHGRGTGRQTAADMSLIVARHSFRQGGGAARSRAGCPRS